MDLLLRLLSLFFRGTGLMLGVVGAGFAILCLGGVFSDRLDAFTHLTPLWLAMGVSAIILGWIFARDGERSVIVGLGGAALLACAILMGPELFVAAGTKRLASRPSDLKIIQFNVWKSNETPDRTLRWLLDQDADVVLIEEGDGPVVKALKAYYPFYVTCDGKKRCGSMIFSRKRMIARNGFYPEGRELAGAWATLADPKGDFTVVGIHYVWPLPAGPQQQQSKRLVDAVARFDQSDLILTGDFNSTPWSYSLKRQDKALGLQRRTRAIPSWPSGRFSRLANAPVPFLPIDHVYAGKAWKTVSVTRGPALGSDHRPIIVRLRRQ